MNLQTIADALWEAEKNYRTIDPINPSGILDIDSAYAIQSINSQRRILEGQRLTGKKIGLTSKAMQDSLKVRQPDFGLLFDAMEVIGDTIPLRKILQPRVEGELAFKLKHDLAGAENIQDVLWATEAVHPAIEIVGSRIRDWKLTIVDTVADNASCGMYMLSEFGFDPFTTDLPAVQLTLSRNGTVVNQGMGSAVMSHPAHAVLWLSRSLAQYGVGLNAGDIVLAGAFSAAVPALPGDEFVCDFVGLGKLSLIFEKG